MMRVDLHVHSHYSDGADSVETVLDKASTSGVKVLSFVDHDIVETYEKALPAARSYGIELIPGIEISAYDFKRDRKVHVLGYHYDLAAPNIKKLTKPLLERRHAHSLRQMESIRTYGHDVDDGAVREIAEPSKVIYKQHIMKHLTDDYNSDSYQKLYKKLFKGVGPAAGDIEYIDVKDAIEAIKEDDGLVVIAHPGQLDSYEMIEEHMDSGIDGIELLHPDHDGEDHMRITELADEHQLFLTGGSDYHGSFGVPVEIGVDSQLLRLDHGLLGLS